MVSIPPTTNPPAPKTMGSGGKEKAPEALRYLFWCWTFMISGELLYQLLRTLTLILDPSSVREATVAAAERSGEDVNSAIVQISMYTSIALMTLFQVFIVVLLAVALRAIATKKKWAEAARRMLTIFSVFFAIRTVFVFLAPVAASDVPVAVEAILGIIQIAVGVAGVCALIYASHQEVRDSISGTDQKDR